MDFWDRFNLGIGDQLVLVSVVLEPPSRATQLRLGKEGLNQMERLQMSFWRHRLGAPAAITGASRSADDKSLQKPRILRYASVTRPGAPTEAYLSALMRVVVECPTWLQPRRADFAPGETGDCYAVVTAHGELTRCDRRNLMTQQASAESLARHVRVLDAARRVDPAAAALSQCLVLNSAARQSLTEGDWDIVGEPASCISFVYEHFLGPKPRDDPPPYDPGPDGTGPQPEAGPPDRPIPCRRRYPGIRDGVRRAASRPANRPPSRWPTAG